MDFDDYQNAARRTVNPALDERDRVLDAAIGLAEEAAEVAGLVRKKLLARRDVDDSRVLDELGDTLWCLAMTAESLGLTLEQVAKSNIEKLARRHPDGFRG